MIKSFAFYAIRKATEGKGTIPDKGQQIVGDSVIVPDQITFRNPPFGEKYLIPVTNLYRMRIDLHKAPTS